MKNYTHAVKPHFNRIQPAKSNTGNPDEFTRFEIIGSRNHVDWGAVMINLGGRAIDKGGDIAGLFIVHGFRFLSTIAMFVLNLIASIVKAAWKQWTTVPPTVYDNHGQNDCGSVDNRTIIVNIYNN